MRVPVISINGKPLMPTKASKARRWIKQGKAIKRWSKLGLFYIQLTVEAKEEIQGIILGLDSSFKFDDSAIGTGD